jgi:hypothetical protein
MLRRHDPEFEDDDLDDDATDDDLDDETDDEDDDCDAEDDETYRDDYEVDPSEIEEGAGMEEERPILRAHGGVQPSGRPTAESEWAIQAAELKRARERAAREAQDAHLQPRAPMLSGGPWSQAHHHVATAARVATTHHAPLQGASGPPSEREIMQHALKAIGPLAKAATPAQRSKLHGLHKQSLLITGPWTVCAGHIAKALLSAHYKQIKAAAPAHYGQLVMTKLPTVHLTSDRELHQHHRQRIVGPEERDDDFQQRPWWELEQDDEDDPTPPWPGEHPYALVIVRVGLMPQRDQVAAGLAAQVYLSRSVRYGCPTWIVSERPYDKRNYGYTDVLARSLRSGLHVELTKGDL